MIGPGCVGSKQRQFKATWVVFWQGRLCGSSRPLRTRGLAPEAPSQVAAGIQSSVCRSLLLAAAPPNSSTHHNSGCPAVGYCYHAVSQPMWPQARALRRTEAPAAAAHRREDESAGRGVWPTLVSRLANVDYTRSADRPARRYARVKSVADCS
jgi:hypothetical protein